MLAHALLCQINFDLISDQRGLVIICSDVCTGLLHNVMCSVCTIVFVVVLKQIAIIFNLNSYEQNNQLFYKH